MAASSGNHVSKQALEAVHCGAAAKRGAAAAAGLAQDGWAVAWVALQRGWGGRTRQ